MRRVLLILTAAGTLVEGAAVVVALVLMGAVIEGYSMSLNGSDPATARVALWILAGVLGLWFLAVAGLLVAMAVRDRPRRGPLLAAASVQWVLTILSALVSDRWVFACALALGGLFIGTLLAEPGPERPVAAPAPH